VTAIQRKYALLGALVAVLAVTLWVTTRSDDPAETGRRPSNQTARRGAKSADAAKVPVEDIALERLQAERDELQPTERNPFRFRPKPPPPAPKPVARAVPVLPPVPAGPPPPPPIPPIPLKYVGFADEVGPRSRLGVFSDGRGTMLASEGDILDGRYRVLRVGTDSADLVYLDGRGRQTIRLSGQ
jgi:hypothetical protein